MHVVIKNVLDRQPAANGSWTFLVDAELDGTVIERCHVTVPRRMLRRWLKGTKRDTPQAPTAAEVLRVPFALWAAPLGGSRPCPSSHSPARVAANGIEECGKSSSSDS